MNIAKLSLITTGFIFVLMMIGGYVTQSGAGLACPDWPLCHGQIIPPLEGLILIEYFHRVFASVTGILIFLTSYYVWKNYKDDKNLMRLAYAFPIFLFIQVFLGAYSVLSHLNPLFVTLHLGVAITIFGISLTITHLVRSKA